MSKVPQFSNCLSLLQYAASVQLYSKLIRQINKDFHMAYFPLDAPLHIDPEDFFALLKEKIYFLLLERFSDFLNLMYIIDIPEHSYRNIKENDAVEIAEHIAFMVLKREWQKVWLKTNYKP